MNARRGIGELGLGADDGEGRACKFDGLRRGAVEQRAQPRLAVGQVLEETLGAVGHIASSIAVRIEAGVVAPVVSLPVVLAQRAAALHRHLLDVLPEGVVFKSVAAHGGQRDHADVVEGEDVVVEFAEAFRAEGRAVQKDSAAIVHQRIARDLDVVGVLEAERVAAWPALAADQVVAHRHVVGIHRINADGIVEQLIALDLRAVAVHEMDAVAPVLDQVVAHDHIGGIPHHHVARLVDVIVLDRHALAVPQAQAVALAALGVLGLAGDVVSAQDRVIRLSDEDAEEHVAQPVVVYGDTRGGERDPRVIAIRLDAAAAHLEATEGNVRRRQRHHGPLSPGINHRPVYADETDGLVHDERAGICAAAHFDHIAALRVTQRRCDGCVGAARGDDERQRMNNRFACSALGSAGGNPLPTSVEGQRQ